MKTFLQQLRFVICRSSVKLWSALPALKRKITVRCWGRYARRLARHQQAWSKAPGFTQPIPKSDIKGTVHPKIRIHTRLFWRCWLWRRLPSLQYNGKSDACGAQSLHAYVWKIHQQWLFHEITTQLCDKIHGPCRGQFMVRTFSDGRVHLPVNERL